MGTMITIGALLGLFGFVGLALSNEGRTAFPAFLTALAGLIFAGVGFCGRLVGLL